MSERRRKTPKIWFGIGITIIIIGFIGGVILGFSGSTQSTWNTVTEEYDYNTVFNITLMIYTWIGCLISSTFFFAVGSILYRLNLIIDGKKYETELEKENKKIYQHTTKNNDIPEAFKF